MLDASHFCVVSEHRPFAIHHDSIFIPAVPKFAAHFHVFKGALIALICIFTLNAIVGLLISIDRCHNIPAGPPTCQMIDRRPQSRGIKRVLITSRERGRNTNVLRGCRHKRQQWNRIMFRRLHSVTERGLKRFLGTSPRCNSDRQKTQSRTSHARTPGQYADYSSGRRQS